jgi:hypothetical protein
MHSTSPSDPKLSISHSQRLILSHSQFTFFLGTLHPKPLARPAIIEELEESQPIKNRNLSLLISAGKFCQVNAKCDHSTNIEKNQLAELLLLDTQILCCRDNANI